MVDGVVVVEIVVCFAGDYFFGFGFFFVDFEGVGVLADFGGVFVGE